VPYVECVPVTKTRTYPVTTVRRVPEEKTENYTVCVPYPVQREVQVQVCRMVPKTIQVPVSTGCANNGCNDCGRRMARRCGC
jgi:hypothetical protein